MPNKKADNSTPSPEDQALEQRVKAIMEPGQAEPATGASAAAAPAEPPRIDIFSDPKTAPAVPKKLLEKIGAALPTSDAAKTAPAAKEQPAAAAKPAAELPSLAAETTTPAEVPTAPASVAGEAAPAKPRDSTPLDDNETEKAVDDIVVNESDAVLAAEDAARTQANGTAKGSSDHHFSIKNFFGNKWVWVVLVVILAGILAYPATRYKVLGAVLKESLSVTVKDSKTNTPVSNAIVSFEGKPAKTDASGKAVLKVPPGKATLSVTKQYYKAYAGAQSVGLRSGKQATVQLVATGRQVPITVLNRITGKPIANAEISILDTTAKTNHLGQATIVLPTTSVSDSATITLNGYNSTHANVQVTSSVVAGNTINMTPAGHVYFLSNLSGTIDVIKTNLDGSGRQTVLKGTGKEDPTTTSLLASRDWHYLVLKAQRDSSGPALYLVDTSNDKITQFDTGNSDFTLVGWYGHDFVYDVVHNAVQAWQDGHEALKSYNADTGQLELLDQSQAEGTSTDYAYQGFYNFYTLNNLVVYNAQWYTYSASGSSYDLSSKSDTIRAVQPDGQGKKDYQSIPASGLGYIQAALFEPQGVYYAAYNYNTNTTTYYKFENGSVSTLSNLSQNTFNQSYPTYLVSPSGDQTFWTEVRDGQDALFVGNQTGNSGQQVASLSGYTPYGWYTDNYLLVAKGSSELYIMPAGGLSSAQQPLKITDYYKPTQTYNGYGYGYGGL